jgi:hypothetical protein
MADTRFVVDYPPLARHRSELRALHRSRRRRLMAAVPLSVIVVVAAANFSAPLAVMLAGIAAIVTFFMALPGSTSVDAGHLAGVEGEAAVLESLKRMPDDYLLLNRVRLPDETLTNGQRELDFIVAGPTGLWVVEVKNTPGHLQVRPGERHWPLARRAGCGSRPAWNAMANPVPQATAQRQALERWLLRQGIEARAQAMIVMAHPEVAISDADSAELPVLVRDQVAGYIQGAPKCRFDGAVVKRLGDLRPG